MKYNKKNHIQIDRAINEFSAGRPIIVNNANKNWIFFTIEHFDISYLKRINKRSIKNVFAFITNKKARNLKQEKIAHKNIVSFSIKISDINWLKSIHYNYLIDTDKKKLNKLIFTKAPNFLNDIIDLAKNSKTIPILIGCTIDSKNINDLVMKFKYNVFRNQNLYIVKSIKLLSKSYIPIVGDSKSIIKIYKSYIGGAEHVALKIGKPNKKQAINVRIQSACITGEVFHSLKCDCNEQLHYSINYLSKNGGGYIIHLEQEGRGIGLINKIKAYEMQNRGMDSIEADIQMGYLGEERDFNIASHILKKLKIKNVNLITNNINKINSLKNNNIRINNQIYTKPTINEHNIKYLNSKIKRKNY